MTFHLLFQTFHSYFMTFMIFSDQFFIIFYHLIIIFREFQTYFKEKITNNTLKLSNYMELISDGLMTLILTVNSFPLIIESMISYFNISFISINIIKYFIYFIGINLCLFEISIYFFVYSNVTSTSTSTLNDKPVSFDELFHSKLLLID